MTFAAAFTACSASYADIVTQSGSQLIGADNVTFAGEVVKQGSSVILGASSAPGDLLFQINVDPGRTSEDSGSASFLFDMGPHSCSVVPNDFRSCGIDDGGGSFNPTFYVSDGVELVGLNMNYSPGGGYGLFTSKVNENKAVGRAAVVLTEGTPGFGGAIGTRGFPGSQFQVESTVSWDDDNLRTTFQVLLPEKAPIVFNYLFAAPNFMTENRALSFGIVKGRAGERYQLNDVVYSPVPEPELLALVPIGLLLVSLGRRARRRASRSGRVAQTMLNDRP